MEEPSNRNISGLSTGRIPRKLFVPYILFLYLFDLQTVLAATIFGGGEV